MIYDDYDEDEDVFDPSQISDTYIREAEINRPLSELLESEPKRIKRENILRGAYKMPIGYIEEENNDKDARMAMYRAKMARDASVPVPQSPLVQTPDGLDGYRQYWTEQNAEPEEGFLDSMLRKGKNYFSSFYETTSPNPYGYTIYDFYPEAKMVGDIIDYGPRVKP